MHAVNGEWVNDLARHFSASQEFDPSADSSASASSPHSTQQASAELSLQLLHDRFYFYKNAFQAAGQPTSMGVQPNSLICRIGAGRCIPGAFNNDLQVQPKQCLRRQLLI